MFSFFIPPFFFDITRGLVLRVSHCPGATAPGRIFSYSVPAIVARAISPPLQRRQSARHCSAGNLPAIIARHRSAFGRTLCAPTAGTGYPVRNTPVGTAPCRPRTPSPVGSELGESRNMPTLLRRSARTQFAGGKSNRAATTQAGQCNTPSWIARRTIVCFANQAAHPDG